MKPDAQDKEELFDFRRQVDQVAASLKVMRVCFNNHRKQSSDYFSLNRNVSAAGYALAVAQDKLREATDAFDRAMKDDQL